MSENQVGRRGGRVYDNTPRPNRNSQIWHDREAGETYADIAAKHGITPERVRQICAIQERQRRWLADQVAARNHEHDR